MARIPSADIEVVKAIAQRFSFEITALPAAPVPPGLVHGVNPAARQIRGLLYNLLSHSIAIADLDGDGLPNDLCYNDARAKALMIAPAPGTGDRYKPFAFDFGPYLDLKTSHPVRCTIADMNEDGLADILVGFAARAPLLLLRKDIGQTGPEPLSSASFVIQELVPDGGRLFWHTTSATFSDVDGDGHLDIILAQNYQDGEQLYDENATRPTEMPDTWGNASNAGTNHIFLWAGATIGASPQVSYRDAGDVFPDGNSVRWSNAVGAADLDHDGLSEIYIANDFGPDQFLLNRSTPGKVHLIAMKGERGFTTPRSFVIGDDTFHSMAIDFADLNGDGMFDMAVSNISNDWVMGESHFLWMSTGDTSRMEQGIAPYVNRSTELGTWHSAWAWDIKMDDFDNDGEVEIVQSTGLMKGKEAGSFIFQKNWANFQQFAVLHDNLVKWPGAWPQMDFGAEADGHKPNPFWVRGEDGRYVDVATEVFPGLTPNTRSIATADVDGDGDLDMAFANSFEDSQFFTNRSPNLGAFLGLHLLLPLQPKDASVHDGHPTWREGTPAIGALVEFVHPDGRRMMRQVDGGNGLGGQRSPDLFFGLGKLSAGTPIALKITWRDRDGKLYRSNVTLKPGWHTVTLAANLH